MKKLQPVEDNRAGYQRQAEEDRKSTWNCECGAAVIHAFGEFQHVGPCSVPDAPMSTVGVPKTQQN